MFGISFGTKSTKGTENQQISSNETTNQTQTGTTDASTKGTQNTSQTGSSTSAGTSGTQSNGTSTQNTSGTQTGVTSNFDSKTLAGLQDAVQQLLGGISGGAGKNTATSALAQQQGFDADQYVSGAVDAAKSDTLTSLEEAVNGNASAIGGTAGTNSAAALLAGRLANNRASTIAGVQSQAEATAQGILSSQVQSGVAQQGADSGLLTQLAGILKGGTQTSTAATNQSQSGTTGQTSSTATNESQQQQQNTSTQSTQDVLTQILQTLQGTDVKTGTSSSQTTGKQSGGGASLSL